LPPMTFGSGSRSRGSGCPELRLPRSRAGRWPFQRPAAWFVVTDGHLADLRAGARLNSSKFSSPPPPLRRLRRASRIRWAFAQSDRLPGLTTAPPAPLLKLLVLPGFAPLPCFLRPVHSRWHRLRGAWLRPVAAKPPTRSVPVVSLHLDGFLRDAVPACCSRFRIWGSPRWPRIDRSAPARPGCPCGRPFRTGSGRVVRRVSDGAAPYEGFLLAGSRTASLRPVPSCRCSDRAVQPAHRSSRPHRTTGCPAARWTETTDGQVEQHGCGGPSLRWGRHRDFPRDQPDRETETARPDDLAAARAHSSKLTGRRSAPPPVARENSVAMPPARSCCGTRCQAARQHPGRRAQQRTAGPTARRDQRPAGHDTRPSPAGTHRTRHEAELAGAPISARSRTPREPMRVHPDVRKVRWNLRPGRSPFGCRDRCRRVPHRSRRTLLCDPGGFRELLHRRVQIVHPPCGRWRICSFLGFGSPPRHVPRKREPTLAGRAVTRRSPGRSSRPRFRLGRKIVADPATGARVRLFACGAATVAGGGLPGVLDVKERLSRFEGSWRVSREELGRWAITPNQVSLFGDPRVDVWLPTNRGLSQAICTRAPGSPTNWINLPNASGLYIGLQRFFLFASPSALL
jgi:hypothetical protein